MVKIPKSMQGVLWSSPVEKLDIDKHKSYIVHQVLMYGNFDHIRWLFRIYPKAEIRQTFLEKPQQIYTKPALNYISKYILGIENPLPYEKYISTLHK